VCAVPAKRTSRPRTSQQSRRGSSNVISDYDPIAEFEREIEGRQRLDGSNVISDYDPIAEFEREIEGRPRKLQRLPPITAAPLSKETLREKGAAKAKPRKPKQPHMHQRYAGDDALAAEGRAGHEEQKVLECMAGRTSSRPSRGGYSDRRVKSSSSAQKDFTPSKNLETSRNISKQIKCAKRTTHIASTLFTPCVVEATCVRKLLARKSCRSMNASA